MINREIRLMSNVTRWSIVKTLRKQSIADHSFHVSILAWRMAEDLKLDVDLGELLVGALGHDLSEVVTSDIPSPVLAFIKKQCGGWKKWILAKTSDWFPWFREDQSERVKFLVSVVDRLEAILFLQEEMDLGNSLVRAHHTHMVRQLQLQLEDLSLPDIWGWCKRVMDQHQKAPQILVNHETWNR